MRRGSMEAAETEAKLTEQNPLKRRGCRRRGGTARRYRRRMQKKSLLV